MVTKIQKWGYSKGLRLPKQVLEDVHISVGDEVDVTTRDGLIVITPARRIRGKDYKTQELNWGDPEGREVW